MRLLYPQGVMWYWENSPPLDRPNHIPYTNKKIFASFHFKIFGRWGGSTKNIDFLFFHWIEFDALIPKIYGVGGIYLVK